MSKRATSDDAGGLSRACRRLGRGQDRERKRVPFRPKNENGLKRLTSEAVLRSPSTPNIKTASLDFRLTRDPADLSEALDLIRNRRVYKPRRPPPSIEGRGAFGY